jgi:hypothetical protein
MCELDDRPGKEVWASGGILPADCARKLITSPVTNTLVSHFTLIGEWASPSVMTIILPRTMYIEAAKRAGAKRRRRL